jgi:hypothetical protein
LEGISGSPVWVRETIEVRCVRETGRPVNVRALGDMKLLGMIQAHWDVSDINKYDWAHDPKGVNIGIGAVVPAKKILEIVEIPEIAALRKEAEDRLIERFQFGDPDAPGLS